MKISIVFPSPSSLIPSARLHQPKIRNPNYSTRNHCSNQQIAFHFTANAISITKAQAAPSSDFGWGGEKTTSFELEEEETAYLDDGDSPWEGAIVYKRSPSITHVEYCTTLERLGLGHVSSQVSRQRASEMGIRVTKAVKEYPLGTPVQVSVDVTRKVNRVRLDGILKTVLSLRCNSCGEATAQNIFSNLTLLLSGEPIEEPEVIDLGTLVGNTKSKGYAEIGDVEEDDEASIDFEDRLYFPMEEKEIDISKHIRDLLHLEINISAVCGPSCRGLCMKCGANLNIQACSCAKKNEVTNRAGPLGNLKQRMQAKS